MNNYSKKCQPDTVRYIRGDLPRYARPGYRTGARAGRDTGTRTPPRARARTRAARRIAMPMHAVPSATHAGPGSGGP